MPIAINTNTGLAENVETLEPHHEVPLYDTEGQPVTAPLDQAATLMQQGYTQPNQQELQDLMKHAHFNSTEQQVKTGLEGAASGATFGLSTAAEVASGIANPEDITARREANPGTHALGELAGFGASMLTPLGAGSLAGKGAMMAAEQIAARTALGKIGTEAARVGIENMMFQAGDEASKAFSNDPSSSAENAALHVGLSGLIGAGIGGGLGAVPELWNLGPGKKVEAVMNAFKTKSAGISPELTAAAGIDVPIELQAALSGDETARSIIQHLQESSSNAGKKVQEVTAQFRNDANNSLASALGRTPEEAISASEAELGKFAQDKLISNLKDKYGPISKAYDDVNTKFESATLSPNDKAAAQNALSELATTEGWIKAPSSAPNKLLSRVLDEMPLQENALDIKKYITNLRESAPYGSENYYAANKITRVLQDAQESAVGTKLLEKEPMALEQYSALKGSYKDLMNDLDELNSKLKVGRYSSPSSFINNLKEMDPETIIKRLSVAGDSTGQAMLMNKYPEIASIVRNAEVDKILKSAVGAGEEAINARKLFTRLDKMTPEMKQFLFSPEQAKQIDSIRQLLEAMPKTTNPSGTARTLDAIMTKGSSTALGIATGMLSGSGLAGVVTGYLSHLLGKEAPDAVKLAFLKFLTSDAPVSAAGLKAAASMAKASVGGERILNKSVDSVFKRGNSNVIAFPTAKERGLLVKQIARFKDAPEALMNIGGKIGHYLPDQAAALASTAMRNISYLQTIEPAALMTAPLDGVRKISKADQSHYDRALDIAQNPMVILNAIKDGSITQADVAHLRNMYPALHQKLSGEIIAKLIEAKHDGKLIPYKTKLGISMFTGQPLESSIQPNSIMQNQGTFIPTNMAPPNGKMPKMNLNSLDKLPSLSRTNEQDRSLSRSMRHR